MDEHERLAVCIVVAAQMYAAGLGDCYDALERLTRPALDMSKVADFVQGLLCPRLPEPTPYERGVLDRYQDGHKRPYRRKAHRYG